MGKIKKERINKSPLWSFNFYVSKVNKNHFVQQANWFHNEVESPHRKNMWIIAIPAVGRLIQSGL